MARRVRRKGKPRPASRYTGLINYPTSSRFSRSCEETGWNLGTPFKRFPSPSTFVSRSEYDRLFRRAIFTGGREIVVNSPPPWKPVPSELDPSSGDASFFFFAFSFHDDEPIEAEFKNRAYSLDWCLRSIYKLDITRFSALQFLFEDKDPYSVSYPRFSSSPRPRHVLFGAVGADVGVTTCPPSRWHPKRWNFARYSARLNFATRAFRPRREILGNVFRSRGIPGTVLTLPPTRDYFNPGRWLHRNLGRDDQL